MVTSCHFFGTGLGVAAIVWGEAGIRRTMLPEREAVATRAIVARLYPDASEAAPPDAVAKAVADIVALVDGARPHLRDAPLDMSAVEPLARDVYVALRLVGPGETTTYGALAETIGRKGEARAVGAALGRNPFPVIVPCHRVLAAKGALGGFSAPGGQATKLELLNRERARISDAPGLFDALDLPLATRRGGQ